MPTPHTIRTFKLIWDQVAQAGPDGKKKLSFQGRFDVVGLFCSGFVDESRFTVHDWLAAFEPHKQTDGSYLLTEEQWLEKMKFHYDGPVGRPFDPLMLREGEWEDSRVVALIENHILPAVYFNEQEFRMIWDETKPQYFVNGKFVVSRKFKEDLRDLVEAYPSPGQVRALGLAEIRAQRSKQAGFVPGPTKSQSATQRLADLLSKR